MCVSLLPSPCRPAGKGVGDVLAHRRLKPRRPEAPARSREEGGCRLRAVPRRAARSGAEGGGDPAGPGRARWAAAAGGGAGRGAEGGGVAAVAGGGPAGWPVPRLPRAPGSLASRGRAFPPPASHCSKFASRWAAGAVGAAELGGPRCAAACLGVVEGLS